MPRKYERNVGGSLLSGDLLSMLGGPSIGMTKMPLESLFDAALGKGAFQNFRNTGTKMLMDTVLKGVSDGALKGVLGKGRPRGRPRKCMCGSGLSGGVLGCLNCFRRSRSVGFHPSEHNASHETSPEAIAFKGQKGKKYAKQFVPDFAEFAAQATSARNAAERAHDMTLAPIYTDIGPGVGEQRRAAGRPRKHKVLKACHHKHQNKCKCPCVEGGAGPMDFLHALDLPNTSQKLANSALEVLMKRVLAGGSQPYDAPLMLGPRMIGGHWYDYINPAWYFKKTMQKVVEPVLHATHIDRVVNAIPGVNLVAAMTGATKMHGAPPPPAAAAPAATKPTGAGRKVKVIGDDNILVQDLEGGRKKSKAKPKDAEYYRQRYARRKAEKEMMKVKVI